MGKVILCKNPIAANPYCFNITHTCVYSIEEVCYYIGTNIYIINTDCFDIAFVKWLEEEINMSELAEKVEKLIESKASLKDIIVTICCSCDYYTEKEINELINIVDSVTELSDYGKLKKKADKYYECGEIKKAWLEYINIFPYMEASNEDAEEYSYIYNRLGHVCLKLGDFKWAEIYFENACEYVPNYRNIADLLFAVQLTGRGQIGQKYKISRQEYNQFERTWNDVSAQVKTSVPARRAAGIRKAYETGQIDEYNMKVNEFLTELKRDFRNQME